MQPDFRPIAEAQAVTFGTVADLRMPSGRIYRAVWGFRGRCCAWWPLPGQARRKPIGLYGPTAFAVIATGSIAQRDWRIASELQHAA